MKKTLVALAVTAFAASASAVTVYDAEGTKVQVDGRLDIILDQAKKEVKTGNVKVGNRAHTYLRDTGGSRFGVRVNHELNDGFYALGRLEMRFKETEKDSDGQVVRGNGFGDVYVKRAYVGLGKKELGELTFGRQLTLADDYGQTDDYEYGIVPSYIATDGTGVVRYDYKGIEGLQIGANYNFAEKRNAAGEVLVDELKNAYGVGAVYETALANGHVFNIEGGYGRSTYVTGENYNHHQDGYELALGYTIGDFKLVGDFGYGYEKEGSERTKAFYVAPGFQYQVIPASRIYGNYLYERAETTEDKEDTAKAKKHGFLLGVDYKLHKHVVAYVEGKYVQTKNYKAEGQGYNYVSKTTDKAIGVGMRVFW
ncbi:porin [Actinobacillus genomosp. 1]|uniref:porin n=1 Tax=Actinobacillus genomosp. 1 TaxID=254839 RepID=UPI002442C07D|nr:porin [Actinobacillus genomosp. 1]WGE91999.1 porin [Actinobacillus genomosp. 1]